MIMALIDVLQQAQDLFNAVQSYLSNIIVALVMVLAGFIVARLADRGLHRLLLRIGFDDRMYKIFGRRRRYARATRLTVVRIIYVVTVLLALSRLNLSGFVITTVLAILVIIVLVSFVLAGIEVIPNITARAEILHKRISPGDKVIVEDDTGKISGTIQDITFTDVHIKRTNGDIIYIPNSRFLKTKVTKKKPRKSAS